MEIGPTSKFASGCCSSRAVVWMALDPSSRAWAPSPDGLKCTRVLKPRFLHMQNKTFDESSGSQPSNHLCHYVSMFSKTFVSKLISKIYFQRTFIIQTHNCQILIRISQPVVPCQVAITVAKSIETYLFCQFYHGKSFIRHFSKFENLGTRLLLKKAHRDPKNNILCQVSKASSGIKIL